MVIKSGGIIESNRVEDTAMPGVLVSEEAYDFLESGFVTNLIIKNNTFLRTNRRTILKWNDFHSGAINLGTTDKKWTSQNGH